MKTQDYEYTDYTLSTVTDSGDGWEIGLGDGGGFWIAKKHGVTPHVGDRARFYGQGLGYPVRGVDLNGVEVFYETARQHSARMKRELAEQREEQRRRYYAEQIEDARRRVQALPSEFALRINGFWKRNPDFWEHEGYELFCCEQAVLIARTLKTPEAVRAFKEQSWEQQQATVPGIDDDHSGNTFDVACGLATIWLQTPEHVATAHGALCSLVSCREYVCWAATPEATAERATRGER